MEDRGDPNPERRKAVDGSGLTWGSQGSAVPLAIESASSLEARKGSQGGNGPTRFLRAPSCRPLECSPRRWVRSGLEEKRSLLMGVPGARQPSPASPVAADPRSLGTRLECPGLN